MKKMIVIAALIGGMLMPAQIMAKDNKGNNKPKVEYRNDKKDKKKPQQKFDNRKADKKFNDRNFDKKKQNKPDVVVVNKPEPRPVPPPPAPVEVVYKYDSFSAIASVVGLAALAAIIAN